MIELITLPLAGMADRVRGGYPEGRDKWIKYLAMATIGPCLALQITSEPKLILMSIIAAFLTMWRQDNGWRGRWVLHGASMYNAWKAARWGLIASLSMMPLVYFERGFLVYLLALPLGAILAQMIAIRLPAMNVFDLRNAWPWSELIELPIIGLIANILGRII
jgi:hypothetical protein